MSLDYQIFGFINNLAGKNYFLDLLGIFGATYLIVIIVVILLVLPLFFQDKKSKIIHWLMVFKAFLGSLILLAINYLISFVYFRPRPFVSYEVNKLISRSALEKSFPSDHAGLAFLIAFIVYYYRRNWGFLLFFLAFLIALSRIYVGVHYPTDVIVGFFLGFLVAFIFNWLEKKKIKWFSFGKGNFFIFRLKK